MYRILTFLCDVRYVFGSQQTGSFAKQLRFFGEREMLSVARTVPKWHKKVERKAEPNLSHVWAQAYAILPQFFRCVDF